MPERLPKMRKKEYRLLWRLVTVIFTNELVNVFYFRAGAAYNFSVYLQFAHLLIFHAGAVFRHECEVLTVIFS